MNRLYHRQPPSLPKETPPEAGSALADIYDFLAAGYFPGTITLLPDESIVCEVSYRYRHLVADELGDALARPGFFKIDPLPRARVWAAKAFGLSWDDDGLPTVWKLKGRPGPPHPTKHLIIPHAELAAAFAGVAAATPVAELKRLLVEKFPDVRGCSVQANYVRLRSILLKTEK